MKTIRVAEAQQNLGLLVQQVLLGAKPVIIEAQNSQQTVLLSLAQYQILSAGLKATNDNQPTEPVQQRVLGLGIGDIWISDDFDEPSEIRNPQSKIQNPKSKIRNPQSKIRNSPPFLHHE